MTSDRNHITGPSEHTYRHRWFSGEPIPLPVGKAVCVGRNYADHAKELNNPVPNEPLLFIKPNTALAELEAPLELPQGNCHFETELTVLISKPLTKATPDEAKDAIIGVALGLDLTLRELQNQLKQKAHPWEIAKAFDHSCPVSAFVPAVKIEDLENTEYSLWLNGELQQRGLTQEMLVPIFELVSFSSQHFTLLPGDLVLTGTPKGVGVLKSGDQLRFDLAAEWAFETVVS